MEEEVVQNLESRGIHFIVFIHDLLSKLWGELNRRRGSLTENSWSQNFAEIIPEYIFLKKDEY